MIKPEFLLTASIIEPAVIDNKLPNGFPHKTLLARIGAISVDDNLQYNEDENEQEREVRSLELIDVSYHLPSVFLIAQLTSFGPFSALSSSSSPLLDIGFKFSNESYFMEPASCSFLRPSRLS